ncbi:MAG: FAD-dependent oxidoreductase [Alphaproteobacteria bacterium]
MDEKTRVVVIGGGVIGCGVLYYLAKAGCSDALLVEANELTSGTTWASSALITHFAASPLIARLHAESLELYAGLEAESGQAVGLHRPGSLRLASSAERLTEYRRHEARAALEGFRFRVIGPAEIRELHPLVDTEGVLGAAHTPDDGHVDPAGATNALAAAARALGAKVRRRCPVRGLERRPGGGWRVATDEGAITAEVVVNAAGMWAPLIAAMVGRYLPIVAMERQYYVTEAVPELAELGREVPVLRDPDGTFYLRQETDALLVGPYERRPRFWDADGAPPQGGQDSLPPFLDEAAEPINDALARVPVLKRLGIRANVNVPTSRGPDGNPLVGPVAGLDGLFVAAGFFAGLSEVSVCRYLAQWILDGEPEIDLWPFDPRRYGAFATKSYARACVAGQHVVGLTQGISYPGAEAPAGAPVKTSPLHERLAAAGAVFGQRFGWARANWFAPEGIEPVERPSFARPNWFAQVGAECRAVDQGVGVLDDWASARIEVRGPRAAAFLDQLCASALPAEPGQGGAALMLSPAGRVAGTPTVLRLAEDRFLLSAVPEAERHHTDWLRGHLPAAGGVSVEAVTGRGGVLVVAGAKAAALLAALGGGDFSDQAFPNGVVREIELGPATVLAYRHARLGAPAWELACAAENLVALHQALHAAGKSLGLADIGFRAYDALRLEAGDRQWRREVDAEDTPFGAGLDHLVDWAKGAFVGREAANEERRRGAARRLVCLLVEASAADAWGGEPVFNGADAVALTRLGGYGHRGGKSLALAVLPAALCAPGTRLAVEILGQRCPATVAGAAP